MPALPRLLVPPALLLALGACDRLPQRGGTGGDSATAAAAYSVTAAASTTPDSLPDAPGDSVALDSALARTAPLTLLPERPVRGGVLVAVAPEVADRAPRCSWRGEPLPCHATPAGARALVPLDAEDSAGTHPLVIEGGGARVERQVTVADTTFERALVFLPPRQIALLRQRGEIARDARAVQQALARASAEQRWQGRWQDPVEGLRASTTSGFGAERFYHAASDSARAIQLRSDARAATAFGTDTAGPTVRGGAAAAWRHSGVDVAVRRGTTVRAPADGIVSGVGRYILTGGTLLLDHGHGVSTAYFHLDSALVRPGDLVRAGQAIARSGNDGLTTGPHLHYGVYVHGTAVSPRAWHDVVASLPTGAATAGIAAGSAAGATGRGRVDSATAPVRRP